MAKGRRKGSYRTRLVVLPINAQITLSTLADGIIITADMIAALTEDFYLLSVDLSWALLEATAGEGPLQVGVAMGDLTVSEILESVTASPTGPDDIIAIERGRRPVRLSGAFSGLNTEEVLDDGHMIRTRCKFMLYDGKSLKAWVLNRSGAALTTGSLVRVTGRAYGRWVV